MTESVSYTLRRLANDNTNSAVAELSKELRRATGKPVSIRTSASRQELKSLAFWLAAFDMLRHYPVAHSAFVKYVKSVSFVIPREGEDAAWYTDEQLIKLSTQGAGYNPTHMLKGLVHEIGHAVEDNVKLDPKLWSREPYANNCCAKPGEDFAESFMLFNIDPDFLRRTTPTKFRAIARISL
jgi:hypothetical protein